MHYKRLNLKIAFGLLTGAGFIFILITIQFHVRSQELPNSKHASQGLARLRLAAVCTNENCRADYVRYLQAEDAYPIPAIRHILWRNESVPTNFAEQMRSWQRIHPDWTFVLWRDRDLEPFVAAHFPGLLAKFKALPKHIMRVDMVRYMLLYQFGGTYADLDYSLVRSLDSFRRFQAVITREPEAHSLQTFGMSWPPRMMASPAFMMSSAGHTFQFFAIEKLRVGASINTLEFAGPFGLTNIVEEYERCLPIATNAMQTVYVPPSRSFYPYPGNKIEKVHKMYLDFRIPRLNKACGVYFNTSKTQPSVLKPMLTQYCGDVINMDPITDRSQPVFAIHDLDKPGVSWDEVGLKLDFYRKNMTDIRLAVPSLKMGQDFMSSW